jgi:hypothetical protein
MVTLRCHISTLDNTALLQRRQVLVFDAEFGQHCGRVLAQQRRP